MLTVELLYLRIARAKTQLASISVGDEFSIGGKEVRLVAFNIHHLSEHSMNGSTAGAYRLPNIRHRVPIWDMLRELHAGR